MSETKEPYKVEQLREKNTTEMNKIESTPLGKEEQGRTNSGNTLNEKKEDWIRTWQDESMLDEINNTVSSELLKERHKG